MFSKNTYFTFQCQQELAESFHTTSDVKKINIGTTRYNTLKNLSRMSAFDMSPD